MPRKGSFKGFAILALVLSLAACSSAYDGMLNPKGIITYEERQLFFDTLALMLIVVLPVIVMSLTFVYHYRVSHRLRDYKPNWSHSYFLESLWWGIPCAIIAVLAFLTWKKTHQLDPYHQIAGHEEKALLIQAIALPWKWLFIYPEQHIASLNYLVIPEKQPIEIWMTTDNVPMSAFFIPQLGSQIYAMAGMRTRLFLYANETGDTIGMNTLFNGSGFSDMRFVTHVVAQEEVSSWFKQIEGASTPLTNEVYIQLLHSSVNDKPAFFTKVPDHFFENVINTYLNSSGTIHPRDSEAKFEAFVNEKE